jgi:hypothetical protein
MTLRSRRGDRLVTVCDATGKGPMGDGDRHTGPWISRRSDALQLLVADRQPRGIYMPGAGDALSSLLGLFGGILARC